MSLDLFVPPAGRRRTATALFDQVRDAVATGRLAPGDRLPTSRELAAELGVARSTITTVYGRLVAEGFATARTGAGTYVAHHLLGGTRASPRTAELVPRRRPPRAPARDQAAGARIDLRTGRPDPSHFPLVDWRRSVVDALQVPPPGYGDVLGWPALRETLAAWIGRSRGIVAAPENVVVTAGAQQAFDLCARVLLAPGDVVAVEDPGYEPACRAFAHHGARVVPVPVDADGLVVEAVPANARAVYVTPSHQSPTGVTMTAERRSALLDLARRNNAAVIEDDYDTEYRYVDRPLEPLQRLDVSGHVVYLGTFSKTLSPSLRLGFIVASPPLVAAFGDARNVADSQPPHLTQAALARLIESGRFDRHLRRVRRVYRARHQVVAAAVARLHDDGLVAAPWRSNAGLHTMVELLPGTDAEAIAARMGAAGVVIDTTRSSWVGEARSGLCVGFGLAGPDDLAAAFELLATILAEDGV